MSLPTPTGNPYPWPPGHLLYYDRANIDWINRERRAGESDREVCERMERELWPSGYPKAHDD